MESFHFDTRSASLSGTNEGYSTSRMPSMARTLPTEKYSEDVADSRYVLKSGDYNIYLADIPSLRTEADALVKRMYSWRGYYTESPVFSSRNPNRLTFVATNAEHLAGTVTLGLDSEECLLADELYGQEINDFRKKGKKVCELSKFALDPQYSSKEIIASLFHLAYIYARVIHNATDLFGEVNPRHARSQQRMFGFRQVGNEPRICPRVGAPAVLLHLELDYVAAQISSLAGSREPGERSIYPYCASHQREWSGNNIQNIN